ncbi:MAG TPA: hypothetical protein VNT31_00445 [Nocardioides sp.]|nr:hypothetical protein [Nocardioides sp.]
MKTATQIWGLWDCEELLSVHLTHDVAREARDEHLERCRCFTDDQDAISIAVQIRAIQLSVDPAPVENPNQHTRGGHHEQITTRPGSEQHRQLRRGGRDGH